MHKSREISFGGGGDGRNTGILFSALNLLHISTHNIHGVSKRELSSASGLGWAGLG